MVAQGEVWLATLDPTIGHEIQKTRPCLVVSPDELNMYLQTVIIAPMTTGSRPAPYRVAMHFQGKDGLVLTDQMRTVDKRRLGRRLGRADAKTLAAVLTVLRTLFT